MKKYPQFVEAFGKVIKKLRLDRGLSQQAFADECDIERKSLTKIENGQMAVSLHMLILLSENLQTTPQRILELMFEEAKS